MKIIKAPFALIMWVFLIKLFTVLYLVGLSKCDTPKNFSGIASISGDAPSYINPTDNYINEGNYYFETAKAGRMPYLGLVYYPFRLMFSKPIALSIVVILQILLEAFSIFYMAKLCRIMFENTKSFWLYIFLSCISLYVTIFDFYILSESFAISFLCIFVYHYYIFLSVNRSNKQLVKAGLFLALAILFKPFLSLLFILIGFEFLWNERNNTLLNYFKEALKNTLIVSLPLLILNCPWTVRNYIVLNKFIPFQEDIYAGYNYTPANFAERNFIQTIGESMVFWDKRSAGCYFEPVEGIPCEYKFPERIFSSSLTMTKIEDARKLFLEYQKRPTDSIEKMIVEKFNALSTIYKNEHRFYYFFITPFILTKTFLFHSGSYYLPVKKGSGCYSSYQWFIKLQQSFMYYLALIFGFIGSIILLKKNSKSILIFFIPIYLIILFPIILQASEFRYFHMAYPFLLIGLVYIFLEVRKKISTFIW